MMYGLDIAYATRTPFIGKISSIEMDWYDVYIRSMWGREVVQCMYADNPFYGKVIL